MADSTLIDVIKTEFYDQDADNFERNLVTMVVTYRRFGNPEKLRAYRKLSVMLLAERGYNNSVAKDVRREILRLHVGKALNMIKRIKKLN